MKIRYSIIFAISLIISSCTSQKHLSYLNNLSKIDEGQFFAMEIPEYKIQPRDILYITVKAITPDGFITDFLSSSKNNLSANYAQNESGGYLYGYDVNADGELILPVIGTLKVAGRNIDETRNLLQASFDTIFNNATVECKLLSFKYTIIGEVRTPGTYINYNNYLTVLEAIGRAGGLSDFGDRAKILVIRAGDSGTRTFFINLQDKNILTSEAYFLLPNDLVIIQPLKHKIFNLNLPSITFILTSLTSAITTTLLLINFFNKQ